MKGLEPSTFCMARAGERSRPFAPVGCAALGDHPAATDVRAMALAQTAVSADGAYPDACQEVGMRSDNQTSSSLCDRGRGDEPSSRDLCPRTLGSTARASCSIEPTTGREVGRQAQGQCRTIVSRGRRLALLACSVCRDRVSRPLRPRRLRGDGRRSLGGDRAERACGARTERSCGHRRGATGRLRPAALLRLRVLEPAIGRALSAPRYSVRLGVGLPIPVARLARVSTPPPTVGGQVSRRRSQRAR